MVGCMKMDMASLRDIHEERHLDQNVELRYVPLMESQVGRVLEN